MTGTRKPSASEALFDRLYGDWARAVHAYLFGRTGDPQDALDLLQETFLRVWRARRTLGDRTEEQQRAWVFAVARNLVIDRYRHQAAVDAVTPRLEQPERPQPSPGDTLEAQEQLALVDAAMRRLPEDLRTVLVMQALGGMTSAQIGAALGRPAGTVRFQIATARKRLATALKEPTSATGCGEP